MWLYEELLSLLMRLQVMSFVDIKVRSHIVFVFMSPLKLNKQRIGLHPVYAFAIMPPLP